ncbi:acyl-CoA dehydrogenase family protein, partial [Thauera sp.]|uniref:acyl-CoA dehydrogenase family protein n=1 Tax=Thauera sp. TaxID=1905334 RepID=UPI00258A5404
MILTPEQELIRDSMRAFAQERLAPFAAEWDRNHTFPRATLDQQQRLAKLKRPAALDGTPLREQRMVVLDLETTGLHLKRDLVISIGAVTIENAAIDFSQQFECTLNRQIKFSESVLIHGIAP